MILAANRNYSLSQLTIGLLASFAFSHLGSNEAMSSEEYKWEGNWFICEFANRKLPPRDGCAMFDDEGFRFEGTQMIYLQVVNSEEVDCENGKVGKCFRREAPSVVVKTKKSGKSEANNDWLRIRYLACEQKFSISDTQSYRVAKPVGKKCFWARKRNFYIGRFKGNVYEKES